MPYHTSQYVPQCGANLPCHATALQAGTSGRGAADGEIADVEMDVDDDGDGEEGDGRAPPPSAARGQGQGRGRDVKEEGEADERPSSRAAADR